LYGDHRGRRPDKRWHHGDLRRRQEKTLPRRRWRRQHDEFARPRRQEKHRRRRWRFVIACPETQHRAINHNQFLRRWRWNAEIDDGEIRRAFELGANHAQATPGIPDVRTDQ
jgi:hypothetical protein